MSSHFVLVRFKNLFILKVIDACSSDYAVSSQTKRLVVDAF
ncbi:hypothetical protein S1OALGB6SA_1904 [Olavius algarvensis spirochete endosymbiont]|nr:hypothetical protein S1OALGB6SA_1904 [Olavius algarvensis spirochete endosymbiont]